MRDKTSNINKSIKTDNISTKKRGQQMTTNNRALHNNHNCQKTKNKQSQITENTMANGKNEDDKQKQNIALFLNDQLVPNQKLRLIIECRCTERVNTQFILCRNIAKD